MGVPKFFRWISERYPKINQPLHAPPDPETRARYFPTHKNEQEEEKDSSILEFGLEDKVFIKKNPIPPDFDRLYLDMNGIIHCCSHNNADQDTPSTDPGSKLELVGDEPSITNGGVQISEAEIFRNCCYYLDRIVTDIVKPKELVYLAIDGVAPRAKMNQQRSRRYRSGKEKEIESTFYGAHLLKMEQEKKLFEDDGDSIEDEVYGADGLHLGDNQDYLTFTGKHDKKERTMRSSPSKSDQVDVKETEEGRFVGKFETTSEEESAIFNQSYEEFLASIEESGNESEGQPSADSFHSNSITPGTPFFDRCTLHLQHFIKQKLQKDPRWANLTVIFSGPDVPGEGEHKIMDFIRNQKQLESYNPNTRHCLFGQDGDLIMLGLATHEPHFSLLREEVVFSQARRKSQESAVFEKQKIENQNAGENSNMPTSSLSTSINSYMHNSNFDFLHMSVLRDYLSYDFETRDVISDSPFELEQTIDDFVFMTFFVGNDFLPHMPAVDIADEAFDLLFYTYKLNRWNWLRNKKNGKHPYLTNAGEIVSGHRLESFLADLGQHENPYYDNKKRSGGSKRSDADSTPDDILLAKEEWDRANYTKMLKSIKNTNQLVKDGFSPVASSGNLFSESNYDDQKSEDFKPKSNDDIEKDGLYSKMGSLIQSSLTSTNKDEATTISEEDIFDEEHISDLKGRYYYEKFGFTPLDAEKHLSLRKAYIEGLVWTLHYYYKGCASWEWFYPYHYGPMLSDLIDLDELLENTAFDNGEAKPFHPYEQLMACLPPSSSYLLPKPYQWLMKSSQSPIIDFYPQSFTVDMNGKRWPWEAVVLLPFIDSKRLLDASKNFVTEDALTSDEKERNQLGTPVVYNRDESCNTHVKAIGNEKIFGEMKNCKVRETNICNSIWGHDVTDETKAIFRPELLAGCEIPAPGFPTLKDAPIKGLSRRRLGIDVFGMRSRYRTAVLELDDELPMVTSAQALSKKFIGNTVYFRYPFLHEGFVTAVSDEETTIRGNDAARAWTKEESRRWTLSNDTVETLFETGEGLTGSGGWSIPKSFVTLSIRPLKEIQTLPDGSKVKVYARLEVQLPLAAVLWSPSRPPPYASFPARLEENPYKFRIGSMLPSLMTDKSKPGKKNQPWSGKKNQPWSGKKNQLWKGKPTPMGKRFLPDEINGPLPRKIDLLPPLKHGVLNGIGKSKRKFHSCVNLPKSSWKTELLPIRGRQRNTRTGIVTTIAAGLVAFLSTSVQADFNLHHNHNLQMLSASQAIVRGGSLENGNILNGDDQLLASNDSSVPSLEFAHGTTTLSFIFDGGIVVAVDSRASIGNFVGSKTTQKVLPINNSMLGTMAGGAADCSFWIRRLQAEARLFELSEGRCIPVSRASRILADALYTNRELGLSVGTMIMGFDDESGPSIFYIDNSGTRIKGDLFAVGSGSTFALGVLDTERRSSMKEEEALSLGITAIRHATFRDAFSGGYIAVYIINKDGWRKAFSEDLAMSGETNINRTFLHDDN